MSGFDTREHDRRIANVIQFGVIEAVDYSNPPKARVRVGELLTGWVRMGAARAGDAQVSWGYSVGEEVVIASPSGDLRQGVIVSAIANGTNAAQASDGAFTVTLPGGVEITISGGAVNISAPGNIIITGDVIADGISLKSHVHGGIFPGGGNTGGPQ